MIMKKLQFITLAFVLTTEFVGAQSNNHLSKNKSKSLRNAHRFYQKAQVQIYDSTYAWPWDTLTNAWSVIPKARTINYVYDMNNNQTSYAVQQLTGGVWVNSVQNQMTYNLNNQQTSLFAQSWNGGAWVNSYQATTAYDINNNTTGNVSQTWNGSTWVNSSQNSYTYDANNNCLTGLSQSWNGSAWINSYQWISTYDINNNMITQLVQNWNVSVWDNSTLTNYTIDVNNDNTYSLFQNWNGSSWDNSQQDSMTFDANHNRTYVHDMVWNGSSWDNGYQSSLNYDSNNHVIYELQQTWNGTSYTNGYKGTFEYNVNGFEVYSTSLYFDFNGVPQPYSDSIYYYSHTTITGINEINSNAVFSVSPNPSNGKFFINSSDNKPVSVEIITSTGQKIMELTLTMASSAIDLSGQEKGIYFLRITDQNNIVVNRKLVVQ